MDQAAYCTREDSFPLSFLSREQSCSILRCCRLPRADKGDPAWAQESREFGRAIASGAWAWAREGLARHCVPARENKGLEGRTSGGEMRGECVGKAEQRGRGRVVKDGEEGWELKK